MVIVRSLVNWATLKQLGSRQLCRVSRSEGRATVGRFIPGRLPQKYRALCAAEMSLASTTTGLHYRSGGE